MHWCHFYFHSLIIISPVVSILAGVHAKRDEPKTIRHKAPFDTLWTEELSNSLCAAAMHSGTFCGWVGDLEVAVWGVQGSRPTASDKKHLFLIWPASLNESSGYSHFSSYRICPVLLCSKRWGIGEHTKAKTPKTEPLLTKKAAAWRAVGSMDDFRAKTDNI